jgi:hypothetical protein
MPLSLLIHRFIHILEPAELIWQVGQSGRVFISRRSATGCSGLMITYYLCATINQ